VRRFLTFLLVAVLLCGVAPLSSGCKTADKVPPMSSPQTVVAVYAGDIVKSIHTIQSTIIGLDDLLPKDAVVKSVDACVQGAKLGLKLADSLTAYQNAMDAITKAAAAKDVNAIINEMEPLMKQILDPISPTVAGARQQIAALITETMKLIWTIRANVPVLVPTPGGA